MTSTNKAMHYIRRNRSKQAIIYIKDNERNAAQKLFCHAYALDNGYEILYDTFNLEDINKCDVMIIASYSMLPKDEKERSKIIERLNKKGIEVEIAVSGENAGRYIDMALQLYSKGRI